MYRYERSGTMHGLFRVRGFTQASQRGGESDGEGAPRAWLAQAPFVGLLLFARNPHR